MSISQRLGTIVAVICGLLLVFTAVLLSAQWRAYLAAGRALGDFEAFRAVLVVMETASAERGPSNGALGEDAPVSDARMEALRRARGATDAALRQFYAREGERERCAACAAQEAAARQAQADLEAARANIDHLLEQPLSQRGPQALDDAVNRMVAVIPKLLPLADSASVDVARIDGEALGPLQMARLAATLREQAGLLGSRYTGALAGRRPLSQAEQYAIELSLGRIDQLYSLIESRSDSSPAILAAFQRMKEQYFGAGLAYAAQIRQRLGDDAAAPQVPTTQRFAERYVPLMRHIIDFRDQMLDLVQAELRHNRGAVLARLAGTTAVALALVGLLFLILWLFRLRVIQPLTEATNEIVAIATGRIASGPSPERPHRGEIKAIFDAVDTLKAHSLDRLHSIQYASLIQRAILPDRMLQTAFGDDHFVLWRPRDIVGGDFYLYRGGPQDGLIGVIDCAGHGVPGALMTMLARSAFNQAISQAGGEPDHDPAALLMRADAIVRGMFDPDHANPALAISMDAALVRLDRGKRQLVFAGAKMSLYASDGNEVREYKGGRRAIAQARRCDYDNTIVPLEAGWTFYLCTDGLLDQAGGEQGYGFGNARFIDMLRTHARLALSEQAAGMSAALAAYQGGQPQRDDITLLAFRVGMA